MVVLAAPAAGHPVGRLYFQTSGRLFDRRGESALGERLGVSRLPFLTASAIRPNLRPDRADLR